MTAKPVEWILVIFYNASAHRAAYGRLDGTTYTKDYIQLSRKAEFRDLLTRLFQVEAGGTASVPVTYRWPTGSTQGAIVFQSADRPHLKWETSRGAPKAWKMSLAPSDGESETIPGDPSHREDAAAEEEFAQLARRGAGQPYLLAIKLRDEPSTLHLRVYLKNPAVDYTWASLELAPQDIQALAAKTSQRSALAWAIYSSGGIAPGPKLRAALSQVESSTDHASVINALDDDTAWGLSEYLRHPGYGLFFDPTRNHDSWVQPNPMSGQLAASVDELVALLKARIRPKLEGDAAAELFDVDPDQIEVFRGQIERQSYEVADATATVKTRGSAQRAFAETVKANYGYRCAITGISTRDFLVASHIVPWSADQSIRLDPSNGICLSLLVDRAFEKGHLLVGDDLTLQIDPDKIGADTELRKLLEQYVGRKLAAPAAAAPRREYLQRRRTLVKGNP